VHGPAGGSRRSKRRSASARTTPPARNRESRPHDGTGRAGGTQEGHPNKRSETRGRRGSPLPPTAAVAAGGGLEAANAPFPGHGPFAGSTSPTVSHDATWTGGGPRQRPARAGTLACRAFRGVGGVKRLRRTPVTRLGPTTAHDETAAPSLATNRRQTGNRYPPTVAGRRPPKRSRRLRYGVGAPPLPHRPRARKLGTAGRDRGRRRHMCWKPICRPDAGGPGKSPGPPLIVPGAASL
jgi:hypothetical protein